jgi:hypothetical protein
MIGLFYNLVTFGFDPSNLVTQLGNLGFFEVYLPFLLIFAVVFAIVSKIPTFTDNTGATLLIALATSLLALQFGIVQDFFGRVFPTFGMGIALLLIGLILVGALPGQDSSGNINKWLMGLAVVIFIYIVITTIPGFDLSIGENLKEYGALITVLLVVGLSIWFIVRNSVGSGKPPKP